MNQEVLQKQYTYINILTLGEIIIFFFLYMSSQVTNNGS